MTIPKEQPKKVWLKNLYGNRDFPDNYTDKTFLQELRRNVHIRQLCLTEVTCGVGLLTQEICTVILFAVTFIYMFNGWCNPEVIFIFYSILTLIGFVVYRFVLIGNVERSVIANDIQTVLIFLVFGYISSPVLHTLTDTVSTDTIYLMTTVMMIVHLIFFDYGLSVAIVSSSLSLNAAIFGSICLASRLSSPFHAFVLMTISVECFALFPKFRSTLAHQVPVTLSMIVLTIYVLALLSNTIMLIFFVFLLFVNVLCPIWFLKWYRYKDNIYGPWDEAIVNDMDDLRDITL